MRFDDFSKLQISFKTIKTTRPDSRLIIAGDGDERILAEKFIEQNSLEDVEMLGFVSEEDKLQLLKSADLYIAPALFGESFGIVLLEAMAMGTPMCGYGNEGYLNVLSGTQQEYFAKPYDIGGLTSRVESLINDERVRSELIREGNNVVKPYDWTLLTDQIEQVYHGILSPGRMV